MKQDEYSDAVMAARGIDRRGLMKAAFAGAVLVGLPAPLFASAATPRLFIYDGRFAQAVAAAKEWQAQGVAILDSQTQDLGHAWRDTIPAMLALGGGIAGMTLWVDSFVCETFGRDRKMAMKRTGPGADTAAPLQRWILA